MLRLFVGLTLPDEVRRQLEFLQTDLPGARWVPSQNMHLTLCFLGEVDRHTAADVDLAMEGVRSTAFDLQLSGIDWFGQKAPGREGRLLYVDVVKNPDLIQLQGRVTSALQRFGIRPEKRKFHPHVTIARLRDIQFERLAGFCRRKNLFATKPFGVEDFSLFSSVLTRDGSHYSIEASYPLMPQPITV
tara:strand:+ start:1055 stop:1618 length:564 start_codon:yes stop_codon:yes gene_type:complete